MIWGSTWLAIKIGLEHLPPFLFAGMRFILATVLLYGFMRVQKIRFPRNRYAWKTMLFLGFFQMLDYAFVFWGEQFIDSAMGAILFGTMPFFVVLLSYFMLKEHNITPIRVIGLMVSFAGVVIIFVRDILDSKNSIPGDVSIILASLCGAIISVYAKKHANEINAVTNTAIQMFMCAILLSSVGLLSEKTEQIHFTVTGVSAVVYLGVIGSAVAFVLYMWVIKKVSAVEASIIPVVTPIIAVFLGWLVLDEKLGVNSLVGCGFILIGVYLVNILREDQLPWNKSAAPAIEK
jgi:drug/metabolite transporter (DMT)-like permease